MVLSEICQLRSCERGEYAAVCCPVVAVSQDAKDEPWLEKVVANSGDVVGLSLCR